MCFEISYSASQFAFKKMSDEDEAPVVKRTRIFYGSLEEKEKERLSRDGTTSAKDAVKAGIKAGHINISSGKFKWKVTVSICIILSNVLQILTFLWW